MTVLSSNNDFVARMLTGHYKRQTIYGEGAAAATTTLLSGADFALQSRTWTQAMPGSLPTGVTSFIPTTLVGWNTQAGPIIVGKKISFGSINLGTNTFTDGSAIATETVAGNSIQPASGVIAEVTTVLNASPGSLSITYVDQSGNAAEATSATALTASAAVGTCSFVPLNTTDWGAIDLTTAAQSGGSSPTGVIELWGMHPIMGIIPVGQNGETAPGFRDLINGPVNICKLGINDGIGFLVGQVGAGGRMGVIQLVGDT